MNSSAKYLFPKILILPLSLIKRVNKTGKSKGINFSEITRQALEEFIYKAEREEIKKQLSDACKLNFEEDKIIASDWRPAEEKQNIE